jgi:Family of unknown function (DUF6152)
MKSRTLTIATLAVGFLTISVPLFAHHGTASYDTSKTVTVKGTVTDFQFINPHVLLFLDVKDDNGNVQKWQGELTSPNHLERAGWTRTSLKLGDQITISGFPAKSGANSIWISKVLQADGTPLNPGLGNSQGCRRSSR